MRKNYEKTLYLILSYLTIEDREDVMTDIQYVLSDEFSPQMKKEYCELLVNQRERL